MDRKKRNTIILISVVIVLIVGLILVIFLNKNQKNLKSNKSTTTTKISNEVSSSTTITTSSSKEDNATITYCKNNINIIAEKIKEFNKKDFIAQYYKEDFVDITASNINCDYAYEYSTNQIIVSLEADKMSGYYLFDKTTNETKYYDEEAGSVMSSSDLFKMEAFIYAKKIVADDEQAFVSSHKNIESVGLFKDNTYSNGNTYLLKICKYINEENYCPEHYYDYEINFSNRTFKKINIDVK